MKKILLGILFCTTICFAQKQHNVWFFGYNAGVTFNSGLPVSIAGGQTATIEGTSGICDTSGNLLFYTEGINVWNKNHVVMPNGTGLFGGTSATQSAVVVPLPGSSTIYYIFTVPDGAAAIGLCYSIVDMTLSGGLGAVTTKNIQLHGTMSEKLTAARHANGTDIWIISHEDQNDAFDNYLLTSTGITTTPVVTHIGTPYTASIAYIGYMKASPDGKKLAVALQGTNTFELYDFDNSTGTVLNPVFFPTTYTWTYGVEFSPDSKVLYGSKYGGGSIIYQFDLMAGSPTAIVNSALAVGVPGVTFVGAIQLGPDGKIYVARYGSSQLGVINFPDTLGLNCNYVDIAVNLSGTCELGLPNCYPAVFSTPPPALPAAHFYVSDTTFCTETGKCVNFFDLSSGSPTSWQWSFPGGSPSSSSLQNPDSICYLVPGSYSVSLIVSNGNGTDTLLVSPLIIFGTAPSPPTITIINGDTLVSSHGSTYQWFLNGSPIGGATDSFYVAQQGGTYAVQITDGAGCNAISSGIFITGYSTFSSGTLNGISIYPNPVSDKLVISLSSTYLKKGIVEIIITDMLGHQLKTIESEKSEEIISMNGFSDGMYMLQINCNGASLNKKFVVTHK